MQYIYHAEFLPAQPNCLEAGMATLASPHHSLQPSALQPRTAKQGSGVRVAVEWELVYRRPGRLAGPQRAGAAQRRRASPPLLPAPMCAAAPSPGSPTD